VRYVVLVFIALILGSLGSALYYMMKDQGRGERMVWALTWRVGLSVALFLFLIGGHYFGLIPGRL
jgi:hypothetical protein